MRSVKRAGRPVRRYRSLLFPGISVLAIFVFYASFVSPGPQKGETARFEQDGLCLEITGVHHIGSSLANFDPDRQVSRPIDTYHVYPGAALTVLEAAQGAWELLGKDETLELADGMDPVKLTEEFDLSEVRDSDTGRTVLLFRVTAEDQEYWK